MTLAIVGFPKCGTYSLAKFHKIPSLELIHRENGLRDWEESYSDKTPLIITRDPIERIWSLYIDFNYYRDLTLKEFLDCKPSRFETIDPVDWCDYEKWIKPWSKFNPIVVKLEIMKTSDGFPHENKGDLVHKISSKDRKLISSYLN